MKKCFIVTVFLGLAFWAVAAPAKTRYRAFTPRGAGQGVFLKSGDKNYKYFVAEKGKTLGFVVTGPTKVKVRTRAELDPASKSAAYQIQIWEGDELVKGRKVKTRPSKLSLEGKDVKIGLARTLLLKVPKGEHSYRIWLTSDKIDRYYVRFYKEKKRTRKPKYSSFRPYEYKKEVTLVASRKPTSYYVVDREGGVRVSVIGPTKLKIYCRAIFDRYMTGQSAFTLGVFQGDKMVKKFSAIAKKSKKSAFRELDNAIPSKLHRFTLDVPSGKHLYEFRMIDSTAQNLAVRFKILTESLGEKR